MSYVYALGSTSIPFAAQRSILYDDFLDEQDKKLFFTDVQNSNRSVLNSLFGFNYGYRPENVSATRRTFGIRYNSLDAVSYSEDLLKLAFYGNAPYAGDTLDLTPAAWWRIKYLQAFYSWGFDQGNWSYDLSAQVLFGLEEKRFHADRLHWYTHESGEYISLSALAGGSLTDTSSGRNGINGLGLGIGATLTYRSNGWTYTGALEDFGLIRWNKNSCTIDVDTTHTYEGLYINNLFDIQDNFFSEAIDSLGQAYFPGEKGARIGITPFLLRFQVSRMLKNEDLWRFGVQYRYGIFSLPQIYVAYEWKPGSHHLISPTIHYGGYNRFGLSLDYRLQLFGYTILLQAGNLNSWIAPEQSYGIHFGAGLRKTWQHD